MCSAGADTNESCSRCKLGVFTVSSQECTSVIADHHKGNHQGFYLRMQVAVFKQGMVCAQKPQNSLHDVEKAFSYSRDQKPIPATPYRGRNCGAQCEQNMLIIHAIKCVEEGNQARKWCTELERTLRHLVDMFADDEHPL